MSLIMKIILVLLLLIAIVIASFLFIIKHESNLPNGSFTYNNVSVSAQSYKDIKDNFNNQSIVTICNLDNKNCIALIKIKDYSK